MAPTTAPAMIGPLPPLQPLGTVLVIGGLGFLGQHIVSTLLDLPKPPMVHVLDLHAPTNALPSVTYHTADISSLPALLPIFGLIRPTTIMHTASPLSSARSHALLYAVNVTGTANILEAAIRTGTVTAFVYTSSASVVSDNTHDLISADESWPYVPAALQTEYYSHTKAEAERLVLAANNTSNPDKTSTPMRTVALRPAGIFGEADRQTIPRMLAVYDRGQTNFQLGSNDNLFDFTYVGNVADAHLLAASALLASARSPDTAPVPAEERVDGEAFFITNDSPVYFWDFPRAVWREAGDETGLRVWALGKRTAMFIAIVLSWVMWCVGRTARLSPMEVRYSCMTRYYDCGKAKQRLGYRPRVAMGEGIRRAVTAWKEEQAGKLHKKDQ